MNDLKKIVIIGPESTGKSTLSKQLAEHYNTLWCPEFAREYLLKNGMNYTYDDLLHIAKGQMALEDEYISSIVNGQYPTSPGIVPKQGQLPIHHSPLTIHHFSSSTPTCTSLKYGANLFLANAIVIFLIRSLKENMICIFCATQTCPG